MEWKYWDFRHNCTLSSDGGIPLMWGLCRGGKHASQRPRSLFQGTEMTKDALNWKKTQTHQDSINCRPTYPHLQPSTCKCHWDGWKKACIWFWPPRSSKVLNICEARLYFAQMNIIGIYEECALENQRTVHVEALYLSVEIHSLPDSFPIEK